MIELSDIFITVECPQYKTHNLIDGEFVESSTNEWIDLLNPVSNRLLGVPYLAFKLFINKCLKFGRSLNG